MKHSLGIGEIPPVLGRSFKAVTKLKHELQIDIEVEGLS